MIQIAPHFYNLCYTLIVCSPFDIFLHTLNNFYKLFIIISTILQFGVEKIWKCVEKYKSVEQIIKVRS